MPPIARKINSPVTYGDYLSWTGEERYELIEGLPVNMGPAPMRKHQALSREIFARLHAAVSSRENSPCELYYAPFDVRLPEHNEADEDVTTVVQPDILLVCDPSKLDDRGCRGAPDLVIEILSPGTMSYDLKIKRNLYEKHGIREYWIVHPEEKIILVYRLENGIYGKGEVYETGEDLPVWVLPGLSLPMNEIFE
jgi:Uma2 family endonuclease